MELGNPDTLFVKLIDFGISSPDTEPRRPGGTPLYSAPEKFEYLISSEQWTGKIDVWYLALVGLGLLGGLPRQPQSISNAEGFEIESPYAYGWHGKIRVGLENFYKNHKLSTANPILIDTLVNMLEEDPKKRVSARRALVQLGGDGGAEFYFTQGMNAEEQEEIEKEGDGTQWKWE